MTRSRGRSKGTGLTVGLLLAAWLQGGAGAAPANADPAGTMVPEEAQGSGLLLATGEPGRFAPAPIVETDVYMWVNGIILRAQVTQEFHNPTDEWVEGVYVFPLPETAAVDHLRMKVGARIIEGEIRERGEARRVYEEAKQSGRKASLVAQQRPNVFTTHVANIGPGESIEVSIEYQETLRYDAGEFHLRFPSVVAPRYAHDAKVDDTDAGDPSGNTDAVPVHSCAPAGANILNIALELDPGFPLESLHSPSHSVRDVPADGTAHLVHLEEETTADRDFVLVWAPAIGHEPQATVFTEERDGDTFVLLMVMPPDTADPDEAPVARETVFVLDTSGSMAGASLEQAKLALHLALDALRPHDRFNIVEFNSLTRRLFSRSVAAEPARIDDAHRYVDSLEANGGTEMKPALEAALEDDPVPGEVRQVVFITDGAVANETALFSYIEQNLGNNRLFTVGIGSAPNSYFMRKAAQFGRGTFTYIGSANEVSERMDALFRKIERPALTDIEVAWNDPAAQAWPARVVDLYLGEPVIVSARLSEFDGGVAISGNRGALPWKMALGADSSRQESTGVAALWARRKIEALMDNLVEGADREEVRDAVVDLGLEHHLVTQYTSLVAVDVTPTAPSGTPVQHRIALNAPFGAVTIGGLPLTATPANLYAVLALLLAACAALARPRRGAVPWSEGALPSSPSARVDESGFALRQACPERRRRAQGERSWP